MFYESFVATFIAWSTFGYFIFVVKSAPQSAFLCTVKISKSWLNFEALIERKIQNQFRDSTD